MPNVMTTTNNFSGGQLDVEMGGRYDLDVRLRSFEIVENFQTNFKGNAFYRTGFLDLFNEFEDCAFHEFKFRDDQNYILVFLEKKIRFITYDAVGDLGFVLDDELDLLEIDTLYTLEQSKSLSFTQNGDSMIIAHESVDLQELKRLASNEFKIEDYFTGSESPPYKRDEEEFPKSVSYYTGRLWLGGTGSEATTIWGSEVGDFKNFTIPSTVVDSSPLKLTLTEIAEPVDWIFPGENSLFVGSAGGILSINGGDPSKPITASSVEAKKSIAEGANEVPPVAKDGFVFYSGIDGRRLYRFSYEFLSESFTAIDTNILSYSVTDSGIKKIRGKKDIQDFLYVLKNNGDLIALNFNEDESILGWHKILTKGNVKDISVISDINGFRKLFILVERSGEFFIEIKTEEVEYRQRDSFFLGDEEEDGNAFSRFSGVQNLESVYLDSAEFLTEEQDLNPIFYTETALSDFDASFSSDFGTNVTSGSITSTFPVFLPEDVGKQIVYKTITGYEKGVFEISTYISSTSVGVNIIEEPSPNLFAEDWYITFNVLTGLERFEGQEVSVVINGGFLKNQTVINGEIVLEEDNQCKTAVVGLNYIGVIKSFTLGFRTGANDTQVALKNIVRASIRVVSSYGGKFGASLYDLDDVINFESDNALHGYVHPPQNGIKHVSYATGADDDRVFYIVQDIPAAFNITTSVIEANYSIGVV